MLEVTLRQWKGCHIAALYALQRSPRLITEAACWSHGRRKFFVLADIAANARNRARHTASEIAPQRWRR